MKSVIRKGNPVVIGIIDPNWVTELRKIAKLFTFEKNRNNDGKLGIKKY